MKYYWLKLHKDFFKRHDIKIIESMENGKDYILFYLKLLVESVSHNGNLRFSEAIPYNEKMLATITDTNVDIVRSAMKVFTELNMIEVLSDETIYMNEVERMIGSESDAHIREQNRLRQQRFRDKQKQSTSDNALCNVTVTLNRNAEIEKEKDIDIDIKKINKEKRFTPPTVEEVRNYCNERKNNVDAESFVDFYSSKGWMVGKNKMKDWKAAVRTWERNRNNGNTTQQNEGKYESGRNELLEKYGLS